MMATDRIGPARDAFSAIAMPVAILCSGHGDRLSWATATVMYVSFTPPQVCVALHPGSRVLEAARASGELSVSLLTATQVPLAIRAGRRVARGEGVFDDADVAPAPEGFTAPGIAAPVRTLWCRVINEVVTTDHVLLIATVTEQRSDPTTDGATPLLRYQRRYSALGATLSDPSPEGYPI